MELSIHVSLDGLGSLKARTKNPGQECSRNSEIKLQAKLNLSRRGRGRSKAVAATAQTLRTASGYEEVCMIRKVKDLRSEFEMCTLAGPNDLEYGQVPLLQARAADNVAATQGWPFGFCLGTRSARCPPSELAKLPLPSVIVYQFPVERVVIPAICQPPRILSAAPFRPPPKCLPCPMGKS